MNRVISDNDLHAKTLEIAARKGVAYSEALTFAAQLLNVTETEFSENRDSMTDARLHSQAVRMTIEKDISYADALSYVAYGDGKASDTVFSESGNTGHVFIRFNEVSPASVIEGQMIEIFKAGTHISSEGSKIAFTSADIAAIAANYRKELHHAPLVEGHPESDMPSRGWVDSLEATPDGRLLMKAAQVDPDFADSVRKGRFKKRSAAFYPPTHPGNPTPGKWYLRHVGWLGAMPPAVSGMKDVDFS